MKILNFGSCNIDLVYSLDHIVKEGETISADTMRTFVGGKGLNQSVALAKANADVYHAGCIGADGEQLKAFMVKAGVDVTHLKTVNEGTGHAIIQVDKNGENSIVLFSGANHGITTEHIDEVLSHFGEGDFLVLQNEINNLPYIVSRAAEKKMKIVLNPAPFTESIRELPLNALYCLIVNEVEAAALSGCDDTDGFAAFLKEKYPQLRVVVTLGKRGSMYLCDDVKIRQPAFAAEVVDTTAAGDTFVGYFVAELSREKAIAEALRTASMASAITVSRAGAAPSIPPLEEVSASKLSPLSSINDDVRKETVLRFLDTAYSHAELGDLAQKLGYTAAYTARWVKKTFGKTFSELLCEKRCAVAADLLKNTDMPIKHIIEHIGYSNESFFRKAFVGLYGEKPNNYRQTFQK